MLNPGARFFKTTHEKAEISQIAFDPMARAIPYGTTGQPAAPERTLSVKTFAPLTTQGQVRHSIGSTDSKEKRPRGIPAFLVTVWVSRPAAMKAMTRSQMGADGSAMTTNQNTTKSS
jgi:hypothetical protein